MLTKLFDFELPDSFVAQNPALPRDHCKLLVYDTSRDEILHKHFFEIADFLSEDDLLVLNKSKVIPARIRFLKGGKQCEIFILKKLKNHLYEVMVRPGKLFTIGNKIHVGDDVFVEVLGIDDSGLRIVKANVDLEKIGELPLPPYIKNSSASFSDYQTVFASEKGSVAAPTAGLHFTKPLIERLKNFGVTFEKVLLHVGLGTFNPIKSEKTEDHFMHSEHYELDCETARNLNDARSKGKRIVAVGTTSVRVLETCYKGCFEASLGETNIFIHPGNYKWKAVDALITNFHLPKSTLLMLVASFLEHKGVERPVEKLLGLYETAKQNDYKFYSFGDAMFIF